MAVDEIQRCAASTEVSQDELELASAKEKLENLVRRFGVTLIEGKQDHDNLACSVALLLFGNADQVLPRGYATNDLPDMSPIKQVASFLQELVLIGRATVVLKGIAQQLGVSYSLADKWAEGCR